MKRRNGALAVCALVVCASQASADVTQQALWRTLSSNCAARNPDGSVLRDDRYLYLPEFGPFTGMNLTYETRVVRTDPPGSAESSAHQSSALRDAGLLRASGAGVVNSQASGPLGVQALAGAGVIYAFVLTEPTRASLNGSIWVDGAGLDLDFSIGTVNTYLYRIVEGRAEYLLNEELTNVDRSLPIALEGVFPAGEYRFAAGFAMNLSAPPDSRSMHAGFDLDLELPAPGESILAISGLLALARRARPGSLPRRARGARPIDLPYLS